MKPHCLLVKVAFLSLCTNVLPSQAAQPSAHIDQCLQQAAQFHKVAYPLLRAIAEQESGFNPLAVRKPYVAGNLDASTDYGLMSFGVILFMLGMAVFFIRKFLQSVKDEDEADQTE